MPLITAIREASCTPLIVSTVLFVLIFGGLGLCGLIFISPWNTTQPSCDTTLYKFSLGFSITLIIIAALICCAIGVYIKSDSGSSSRPVAQRPAKAIAVIVPIK
ncbi:unnamed protein product [Adineta steineri]|uniref:Uncharacterized protein n=1 Tax=Adineta steineri TaxID=433720 RepID=A0A819FBP2_9BILA|nr:unnamed protein product [Adineta steineri]CAF1233286.1 unnamed protein product [Adineta steineri]CAF3679685.1 unnamed protein product [Adineta steineri]CAF3865314.1 unnamed protein product [Adineta steineri]